MGAMDRLSYRSAMPSTPVVLFLFGLVASTASQATAQASMPSTSPAARRTMPCESRNGERRDCPVPGRSVTTVALERQLGGRDCVTGYNWGTTQGAIWVAKGCRGVFSYQPRGDSVGAAAPAEKKKPAP